MYRLADDLHGQRKTVHRRRRERRTLLRRVHRLHTAVNGRMSTLTYECFIRQEGDNHVNVKYPAAILVLAAIASPVCLLRAQAPPSESRSVWDGVYTEEQANRGEPIYRKQCAACHGDMLTGGESAPPLTRGAFLANWNGLTMGDLFDRIRKTIPPIPPRRL